MSPKEPWNESRRRTPRFEEMAIDAKPNPTMTKRSRKTRVGAPQDIDKYMDGLPVTFPT
jgi:hypothetical protein